ncbi:response regulator [Mycobacterium sp. Aquia_213]|uniref:response regulator n=1 Tax=Mycobacterium sp. Aquia_213 TaxID=2991728 RepID=UPI0022721008|nr:response regulator transcription factor [Mycobacterium sp. Aquia_213]WAC90174.1 response regulator transcription factor [Mycobacterium sp. Aquia_213]
MSTDDIAVLLVDDQELVRSGLRRMLRPKSGFKVVGECSDGSEVPAAVAQFEPDIVVMDLRMKHVSGIEATRSIQARDHPPPVLVLTTFDDDELLSGALRAGAAGFILKDSPAEELIRAIRAVADGEAFLDPAVTGRILTTYRAATPRGTTASVEQLTARELDVLALIGQGRTNTEIGRELGISALTVKTHVGHIFVKLGLRDRAAAIVYAFDRGIVMPECDG